LEISSLSGVARVEIKTIREERSWAAYISFISERSLNEACLVLGHLGVPRRFIGRDEKEAPEAAKDFLQQNYKVLRMAW
jgi:hypothetical protein